MLINYSNTCVEVAFELCFSMFFNANDLDYIFLYLQDLKKLFNLQRFHMCFHMCTCINKKMDSLSI